MVSEEKMAELRNDKTFMQELSVAKDANEVQKLFKSYGVDVTIEELEAAYEKSKEAEKNGELTEAELENASGGLMGAVWLGWCGIVLFLGAGSLR